MKRNVQSFTKSVATHSCLITADSVKGHFSVFKILSGATRTNESAEVPFFFKKNISDKAGIRSLTRYSLTQQRRFYYPVNFNVIQPTCP
jgi:hypothetical protein